MSDINRGPAHALGRVLTRIVVGLYLVIDAILSPIFGPFMRWLSSLHVIKRVEAGIASLPPYAVLALLAVPFGVEELVKLYGIVLMGGGHFKSGLTLYIGAHVFAILVCERIFEAGKGKLLTIAWFARFHHWLMGYKDRIVAWFKTTETYRMGQRVKAKARERVARLRGRARTAFGR
jgi:hypothetical protein